MKIEIAVSYKTGEIANTASILVDQIVEVGIDGTQTWPILKEGWVERIRGQMPGRRNLKAEGITLGYRGYPDGVIHMERRSISVLLEEPRILIFTDEEVIPTPKLVDLSKIFREFVRDYGLRAQSLPPSLVFPKEKYARDIISFDSHVLNIH